ncbi:glycosyl hydrolase family 95 catalytic domain-containing protein [Humibacter ginsengisoli]
MTNSTAGAPVRLRWNAPARRWTEATPVGNGSIGAMVFGDGRGRLALNDSSVWSGTPDAPHAALNKVIATGAGPERLRSVRDAVASGDDARVEELLRTFEGPWSQEFLPLGDLDLELGPLDDAPYERVLDLDAAVVTERFRCRDSAVKRRTWASASDDALFVELVSEHPIDAALTFRSGLRVVERAVDASGISIVLETPVDGAPAHEPEAPAHRWRGATLPAIDFDPVAAVAIAIRADGSTAVEGDTVRLRHVRSILLTVTTETNARRAWQRVPMSSRDDLRTTARGRADELVQHHPESLRHSHMTASSAELGSSRLAIGARQEEPVDVVALLSAGDHRAIATVMYAFGRYLLFSSSRAGSPPANLQGIWNDSMRPPWSSNYTININTQMNYWLAERTGLGAHHTPLLDLIERLSRNGEAVARELYGARGWVAHHNTDPWGYALPAGAGHGAASWAFWPMGGLWLCDHLWQRWEYGRDRDELAARMLPILRGASSFALDWLVRLPDDSLGTSPSTSPENSFRRPDGSIGSVSTSSTMDLTLIRTTFERTLAAAAVVGEALDDPLLVEVAAALPRLQRPEIAGDGSLREWGVEASSSDPHHRHLSHLIGLFPLNEIDSERTPELAAAARRTLDLRGPGAMGWSWAWKIALRARLGDGETALSLFREATRLYADNPDVDAPVDGSEWGGLLPNLFSTHPPFQLDGNFGFTTALAEMLVGSGTGQDDDPLRLLPALPAEWPEGEITGIRTRGGLAVDLSWLDGRPSELTLTDATGAARDHITVAFDGKRVVLPVSADPICLDDVFAADPASEE